MEIIRHPQRVTVVIHTARPGVIIGVKGANIEKLGSHAAEDRRQEDPDQDQGDQAPETDAQLIAENVAPAAEGAGLLPPGA